MVVDSSAFVAVLLDEPEAEKFRRAMHDADSVFVSSVSYLETAIVISSRLGEAGLICLDELLDGVGAELVAFDETQTRLAAEAWRRFGKGRHPAKLNFGDCCSYALARHLEEPLLFKGEDFPQTDIVPVFR